MEATLIIYIIIAICSLCIGVAAAFENSGVLAFLCGIVLAWSCCKAWAELNPAPTAMDVVQGNITMRYDYIDGIKVDSSAVFIEDYFDLD